MREILYRAISMARGEHWLYGQPRHSARNPHTEKWTIYDPTTGIETDIVEETLGQYTGLTDKNGNKIFEGDILRVKEFINMMSSGIFNSNEIEEAYKMFTLDELKGELLLAYESPVVLDEGAFCLNSHPTNNDDCPDIFLACLYGDMKRSYPIFDFEVVGNIHNNPDMLKGGENG